MRKSRLKILPARCLAQLGFLLLYLACPILGEMSRAQPDHGLASSLTLHVLEHCASPPKDPGDGSCSPVPEDTKVMTRNEHGHATCSVISHLLNLATMCVPEDHTFSERSPKVTTVTLLPRRLLAARSKLPASIKETMKTLPKRQFRYRSLKRDTDTKVRDSSNIAGPILANPERVTSRRSDIIARSTVVEKRNARTEVTRIVSRGGSENFRGITSERFSLRYFNRNTLRSTRSRDNHRAVQGESSMLRRASYSRDGSPDTTNKLEFIERPFADNRYHSPSSAERRASESFAADHRSRQLDTRRVSSATLAERRLEHRIAKYESRSLSAERTFLQTDAIERRTPFARISEFDSSKVRSSRRTSIARRMLDSRTMGFEARKTSRFTTPERKYSLEGSRTATRDPLLQSREAKAKLQNDERRRVVPNRTLYQRTLTEVGIRESRTMPLVIRHSLTAHQRTSPDSLSFQALVIDRESRRLSLERLSVRRSSTDRRLSESEARVSAEERRTSVRSPSESRISASRISREDTRRHLLEMRHTSLPARERYDVSRRLLGLTRDQRYSLGTSQQTLLRRRSDEGSERRSRDGELSSRLIRDNSIISGTQRIRRSISLDRSDINRQQFSRLRRSLSLMHAGRYVFTTTTAQSSSMMHRRRNMISRNLPSEMRLSQTNSQQHLITRMNVVKRNEADFRELSLSQDRERARTSLERRVESPASSKRRARSLEERSAAGRAFTTVRQEVRGNREHDRSVERASKATTVMERRDARRTSSERSFGDRRNIFRSSSRSDDPTLTSRRVEERHRMLSDRPVRESFNFRSRSAERDIRRARSYAPTASRESVEERNLARISRENGYRFLHFSRADSVRNAGRRVTNERTTLMRGTARALNDRSISRQNRKASLETLISADRKHALALETTRGTSQLSAKYSKTGNRIASSRSPNTRDSKFMIDSNKLQETSHRLVEQINRNARIVNVRSLESANNYRIASVSVERELRQNVWAKGRNSQRDDRFSRQFKALTASHLLTRNVKAIPHEVIRRQSALRQNVLVLKELRRTPGNNYQSRRYFRPSEVRHESRYIISADRKNIFRDSRQSTNRLTSVVEHRIQPSDFLKMVRSATLRNYALTREQREFWNDARFSLETSQGEAQKPQRCEISSFKKLAVDDNRPIISKTDRAPEVTAENVTAKTDMVRDATVEAFIEYNSSWLKDLTATFSMKWQIGALWQQVILSLAALSWTKAGYIDSITDKVSNYLFTAENMDIFDVTKTSTSNDRDNLLGTVIGGGAAAAALLLFSTRTK